MTASSPRFRSAALSLLFLATLFRAAAATDQFFGAIFTSTKSGAAVNANIYEQREAVYLNGGPQNASSQGLPDGIYYFQVTDPSGAVLLSQDAAVNRQLVVRGGRVVGALPLPGAHADGDFDPTSGTTGVQLFPYAVTPNEGGEYKAWLIMQTADTYIDLDDPRVLHFVLSDTKTDNFKVVARAEPLAIRTPTPVVQCNDARQDGAHVTLPIVATSGGVAPVTVTYDRVSGAFFPIGVTTVTATATDATGATVSCAFTVTVTDCEGPRLAPGAPTSFDATLAAGSCTATVTYDASLFVDFSGVASVTFNPASGSSFPVGASSVSWRAVDTLGNVSTGSLLVNVTDRIAPTIDPMPDLVVSNDPGQCSAVVNFTPRAYDCSGAVVVASPASGSVFPKGTTAVTVTATDPYGNRSSLTFNVTVNDTERPTVTAPANVADVLWTVNGSNESVGTATATDNCGVASIVGTRSDGRALTDPYPLGTTTITWTVTDTSGNTSTATQTVTITGASISATKVYDVNLNGVADTGETVLAGWKITLTGTDSAGNSIGSLTGYTTTDGRAIFANLPVGTYSATEANSVTGTWLATSAKTRSVALTATVRSAQVTFTNVALGAGGGLTIGFWSNKNGEKTLGPTTAALSANLAALSALNLRNASGADFNPTTFASYNSWLLSANATNMAYMLSAQLSAMYNNVNVRPNAYGGSTSGTALIYAPGAQGASSLGFMSVNALIAEANASLASNPMTTAAGAARDYQTALKNALDDGNNNRNFLLATPPAFGF